MGQICAGAAAHSRGQTDRGLFAPNGWGDFVAYWTTQFYFVPWLVGVISLAVITWLTQERR